MYLEGAGSFVKDKPLSQHETKSASECAFTVIFFTFNPLTECSLKTVLSIVFALPVKNGNTTSVWDLNSGLF